jgi:hypothetical protein
VAIAGIAVVVVAAYFVLAPVVYSPSGVYQCVYVGSSGCVGSNGEVVTQPEATIPNWHSLSCWALGFGARYGNSYGSVSYQFGCYPPYLMSL